MRLVEATSSALAAQLVASVAARRPLEMPFDEFVALRREAAALVDEGGWRWVYAARALAQPDGSHLGTLVSTCAHAAGESVRARPPVAPAAGHERPDGSCTMLRVWSV